MVRRNVLLPLPLGPTITTTSPLRTVRSTPRNTWLWPKYLWMPWASTIRPALADPSGRIMRRHRPGQLKLRCHVTRTVRCCHGTGEMRLQPVLHETPQRGEQQVVQGGDDKNLQHLELHL